MASLDPQRQRKEGRATVKTTVPRLLSSAERTPVVTERLILRPFAPGDLEGLHALRTQPEVMQWTSVGRVDADLAETQAKLDKFLPPHDAETANCAICWRETGELIGSGGCHLFQGQFGWPEVGYMLRSEFWGKGLATEFLRGFLGFYDALPRVAVEREVDLSTVPAPSPSGMGEEEKSLEDGSEVEEELLAVADAANAQSIKILGKCGFERFMDYNDVDMRDPSKTIDLVMFRYFPGRSTSKA